MGYVLMGLEGGLKCSVLNNVLVAAASPGGESTGVVGVELGKREVRDVELVS